MAFAKEFLVGSALGAGMMWLFDVQSGRRRRAILRDKATRYSHLTTDAAEVVSRDLLNRGQGIALAMRNRLRPDVADDGVVHERVRSKLGRVCSHPHAIEVGVRDGHVTLRGPVLRAERARIVRAIRLVRGVHGVEDQLELHAEPDVPALTGGARRIPRTPLGQEVWSPALRFLVGSVGASAVGAGLRRGGPIGIVTAILGCCALARSVTNEPTRRLYGLVGRRGPRNERPEATTTPPSSAPTPTFEALRASAPADLRISIH